MASELRPGAGVSQLPMTAAAPAAMISAPEQANVGAHGSQMLHGRHAPSGSGANLPLTASVSGRGAGAGKNGPSAGKNGQPAG
jgi:hypothetical protein